MGAKQDNANDKPNMSPSEKEPPGIVMRFFFSWMFPIFYNGNRRDLEEEDLRRPLEMYDSKVLGDRLEKKWFEETVNAKAAGRVPSFTKALVKAFFWSYLPAAIMQFLYTAIRTVTPLLFAELLKFWSVDATLSRETAAIYAAAMIISMWISIFLNHHGALFCGQFGMKLRVATGSVMFRKIMRMNHGALGDTTVGKVVNILSNDLQRFDLAFLFINYVWIIPIQMAAVFYLGYLQAGVAAIIGIIALIVISLPIQGVLGRLNGIIREKTARKTDERIKVMSEVINGIQVIKMYAWEIPFQKVVKDKRKDEMKSIRAATIIRTNLIGFLLFTERTALFITILTYVLLGNAISANVIYPLMQFMGAAQINVALILPLVLSFTAELVVALNRVEEFMNLDDRPDLKAITMGSPSANLFRNMTEGFENEKTVRPLSYHRKSESVPAAIPANKRNRSISYPGDVAVELSDVSASWTGDPNMLALKKISVRIRKGKLCAIIGAVGSGKSSLLQLLLKELPEASGSVSIHGELSYACQEAWLFPSTVRENILFGLPYEPEKYKKVCKVCALEKDFLQFPYGDQTLVGERGVSLSGGQRARINLARAVYRQANIYLLDDPLSAVDANVGRQLFDGCINGYLRGQTRILVTHQIHFLKTADFIIIMNNGAIENMGTFDELASSGKEFSQMLTALQDEKEKDTESTGSGVSLEKVKRPSLKKSTSRVSKQENEEMPQFEEQKMVAEERQSGGLKWEVFTGYFLAGGNVFFIMFVLFMITIATACAASVDYWVSFWSNQMVRYEEGLGGASIDPSLSTQVGPFTTERYIIIMGVLVGACILLTQLRIFPFISLCMSASRNLHNKMFFTMLRGVMRFFDTSSSGRILNRFTKDMGALDEILPRSLLDVFQIYTTLAAILVLNAIALYWTLVPSAVLILIFAWSIKLYLKTAQGVKRLEGTTKSPVFGMVTSSLNGIATIRSAGAQNRLIENFDTHQDLHTCAWYSFIGGGSTYGFYLDTLCLVYLAVIIFVFLYIDFGGAIAVGSVGLAVTQSNMLTMMLQHGARMMVEFIAQMTSVERVMEYTKIDTEENLFEGKVATPPTWPMAGRIEFRNVSMRYAPDEAPILKELNIVIESGWKVGIVGRTGAGKSSLISAMFRFAFIDGLISIDGIDTALVSRQGLRSKISIIPQEPVLFSATIRYNLDPFNIYSDDDIWRALEQVDMKSAIPGLDFKVTEGGANFSVGQRQLMCLARAVLRSNKILIMDEATANVDPQTDNFIQQTIRRQFASCTVLTIAHRLNTIMDSDRVLVMSTGRVAEFDHPYNLLSDPNSHLSSMVKETGEKSSAQLLQVAKDAYFKSNMKENAR